MAADVVVLGGGIVGLSCARQLLMVRPHLKVEVWEKESNLAQHQSGHSSNVLHSGVYYQPKSLRAQLCVNGRIKMVEFCREQNVQTIACGKLIVATQPDELERLRALYRRGCDNGVPDLRYLEDSESIAQIEPEIRALAAIHSPHTGIVDYGEVVRALGRDFEARGGTILYNQEFRSLDQVSHARNILNCGGLYADRIAVALGGSKHPQLIPVRGDYLTLRKPLIRGMVYPCPNPALPFLGIHVHRTVRGTVECGPNAMLAFSRQGYRLLDIDMRDLKEIALHTGLWRLVGGNMRWTADQLLSGVSSRYFATAVRKFLPSVRFDDFAPASGGSGVRALALSAHGKVIDDFVSETTVAGKQRIVSIRNAPSPAATSALSLAQLVVEDVCSKHFSWS